MLLAASPLIDVVPGLMIWTLVCFGITFFVLRKYAFGPIQKMIDERRDRIRSSIEEAEHARAEARRLLEEHKALIGREYRQTLKNEITQAKLKQLKLPTLLIAGTADMSTPPSISRMIAAEIPNSRVVLMPEAGHSSYWEQPEIFNRAVLDFIGSQSK